MKKGLLEIRMRKDGAITIPAFVRRRLGLCEGHRFIINFSTKRGRDCITLMGKYRYCDSCGDFGIIGKVLGDLYLCERCVAEILNDNGLDGN